MIKVGITGGIGSGKSTVCGLFEAMDIPVYYADDRAKFLMTYDQDVKAKIISIFGLNAYAEDGKLDRKYIASKVFDNKPLLEKLNSIVHPAVKKDGELWFEKQKTPFALKEAALLIESKSYLTMDKIIVVTCPEPIRIARVVQRDNTSEEEVIRRIQNQMPEIEKTKLADFLIVNDNLQALIPQVLDIYKKLTSI